MVSIHKVYNTIWAWYLFAVEIFFLPSTLTLLYPGHQMYGVNTSWLSYDLTQFWHYLPGNSIRSQKLGLCTIRLHPLSTSDTNQKSRLSPRFLTDQLQTHNSFLEFDHLLEWLTEIRTAVYLLDHPIIKGYNSWKRCTGQGRKEDKELPWPLWARHPSAPPRTPQPGSSLHLLVQGCLWKLHCVNRID